MNHFSYSVFSRATDIRAIAELGCAAILTALLCLLFYIYPSLLMKLTERFRASTKRPQFYIVASMLLPLVVRLALLPWLPSPTPIVHDEFGHLLEGDTLSMGRLTNPPHQLWRHFETIYVLQQPTYSSSYPIGQGITLAIGKILTGNPWAGVLLSCALMCAAITWMLFGCLPAELAAIGGIFAALDYGLAQEWVSAYWGGAFCALGGALLFGALCRLYKAPSRTLALLVGLGWSIVWLTRPFESLLPLVFSWGLIAIFMLRDSGQWKRWLGPIAIILSIQVVTGGLTALHNRAVTGSFTTLPYQLSQKTYGIAQSLLWQKPIEEQPQRYAELTDLYRWQRSVKAEATDRPLMHWVGYLNTAWEFYITPWFTLPILLLAFLLKDRWVSLGIALVAGGMTATILYPFFFPHYIAAYSCVVVFLIARGMGTLYQWSFRGIPLGPVLVLFLLSGGLMMGMRIVPVRTFLGNKPPPLSFRGQVAERLKNMGGRHVVFVRYGADHSFLDEWVYNAADIDGARIVWCRATDHADEAEVTRYYNGRQFWVADVDRDTARLSRYQPELKSSAAPQSPDWVWKGQ